MISASKISVIIPCINEATNLSELIPLLLKFGGRSIEEIIVSDGGSTDDSREIANELGAKVIHCEKRSRAYQMNCAASHAKGDVLYFVHADTRPLQSFASDIQEALTKSHQAGCYRYQFQSDSLFLKINSWFTRFNGLLSGGGDQTLFITKALFEKLDGFDETYCIMEDFDLVRRVRKQTSFHIIPKSIQVSARKYESNSWLRVQIANLAAFCFFILKKPPTQIKGLYYKLLNHR